MKQQRSYRLSNKTCKALDRLAERSGLTHTNIIQKAVGVYESYLIH